MKPYLDRIGNKILYMGPTGSGQLTKLINQLLFDINAAALGEILPMAAKMGLDPDLVGEVVNSGTGRSYASEFFIPRILRGHFGDGYPMAHAYKDLVSAAELGAEPLHPDAGARGRDRDVPGGAAARARREGQGRHGPRLRGAARRAVPQPRPAAVPTHTEPSMTDEPHGLDRGLTNYGDRDFARYLRRSFARSMGISTRAARQADRRHRHDAVRLQQLPPLHARTGRGRLARRAGRRRACRAPFPTVSLGEVFLNPTSMMYRNLMAMDTEEMIGAQPMDAVVLIGGCDKTVPAQLMGAASAGLPAIQLVTGPMSTGRHKGQRLGACTDCRGFWAKYRAGSSTPTRSRPVEGRLSRHGRHLRRHGHGLTMACIAEALGMSLPGTAAIPAVHSDRLVAAEETGKAAVRLIASQDHAAPRSSREKSVENAIRVLMAVGGSTNAIVHLTAIAGRLGIRIPLSALQRALRRDARCWSTSSRSARATWRTSTPPAAWARCCASCRPLLHLDTIDVEGRTLAERLDEPRGLGRPGGDPAVRRPGLAGRRAGRAERQPRAGRRDLQARRGDAGAVRVGGPGGGLHRPGGSRRAHRRPGARRRSRATSWCCRTPDRTRRACRRPATCRSRRSWRRPG